MRGPATALEIAALGRIFIDPIGQHFALAFNVNNPPDTHFGGRPLILQELGGPLRTLDAIDQGCALDPRRRVDDIAKQAKARIQAPHDGRTTRPAMKAHPDIDGPPAGLVGVNQYLIGGLDGFHGEFGHALDVVSLFDQKIGHGHVAANETNENKQTTSQSANALSVAVGSLEELTSH